MRLRLSLLLVVAIVVRDEVLRKSLPSVDIEQRPSEAAGEPVRRTDAAGRSLLEPHHLTRPHDRTTTADGTCRTPKRRQAGRQAQALCLRSRGYQPFRSLSHSGLKERTGDEGADWLAGMHEPESEGRSQDHYLSTCAWAAVPKARSTHTAHRPAPPQYSQMARRSHRHAAAAAAATAHLGVVAALELRRAPRRRSTLPGGTSHLHRICRRFMLDQAQMGTQRGQPTRGSRHLNALTIALLSPQDCSSAPIMSEPAELLVR